MRLLPRTARGTWLLAGAVWLAGCAVVWWVLPARPRAVWPMPGPNQVVGCLPNSSILVMTGFEEERRFGELRLGNPTSPLRFWNSQNGTLWREVLPPFDSIGVVRFLPTGRVVGLTMGAGGTLEI